MVDYSRLETQLSRLLAQYDNLRTLGPDEPALMQEAVAESVIQRFETCYDCMWKVLKRHLLEVLGVPEVPNSPKPVFRLANENGLLPSDIERWLGYANARTATAHDYSGEKAQAALGLMDDFVADAIQLLETLSGKSWA